MIFGKIVFERILPIVCRVVSRCNVARIRKAARARPIRVMFYVTDASKWKGQSLFDRLAASGRYEPFFGIYLSEQESRLDLEKQKRSVAAKAEYFSRHGREVKVLWREEDGGCLSICETGSDVVFYQQPWELPHEMEPWHLFRHAYSFYFPYFLPNSQDLEFEIHQLFHRFINRHIVLNEKLKSIFEREIAKSGVSYAGKLLPLGHPMTDLLSRCDGENVRPEDRLVIYAPHWTFAFGSHQPHLRYSTFLENGRMILDFAKAHPEVKWAFKPHPLLRQDLSDSGAMTKAEVDRYYGEWETIGEACYDGDYVELFNRSRAMITDCGSFLTEFACTGNPIIRLVSKDLNMQPGEIVKDLYSTYYNSHDNEELGLILNEVILKSRDKRRTERIRELEKLNLSGTNAAGNIMDYMNKLFRID